MILTGKAKEDFYKWLFLFQESIFKGIFFGDEQDVLDEFDSFPEMCKYALITEWFDSVGNLNDKGCVYNFKTLYLSTFKQLEKHHSILDIQKIAIKKANEIYNDKK